MKENDYLLIKEIEKNYGQSTTVNPLESWNDEKEEQFRKEVDKKSIENYKKKKEKKTYNKNISLGCSECGKNFSPKFIDQIHIIKHGLCFDCYTKTHY